MNKRGFTLIELIVVIAIIGVLVLIATPKILNYTVEAREARIKHDIKVAENEVEIYLIKNEALPNSWSYVDGNILEQAKSDGKLYDRNGLVTDEIEGAFNIFTIPVYADEVFGRQYKEISNDFIDSKEKGKFYVSEVNSKVYYVDVKMEGTKPEDSNVKYTLATDADFSGAKNGLFKYTGTDEYVEIPHFINGVEVTSYASMFSNTSVKGVKSTNPNITYMSNMFYNSKATELDLSELDTSNVIDMGSMFMGSQATKIIGLDGLDTSKVTNMQSMFNKSQATELDLSSFKTTNVTNMGTMFQESKAIKIDLSSFNTSNVTRMDSMFKNSQATELDLSSFNTSKVDNMYQMFTNSKVITLDLSSFDTANVTNMSAMFYDSEATVGYARTQEDADKFNNTAKPTRLNFIVKQ
ncbi:BspA family leucine-rich repeat surface protein [Tissierella praeacuta]|uniref:BspA family leucine-rich repeat surface protein n=1 Tax=Tissierella praeacuta TaxID=43131 RepID=UPI00333EF8C8